jgi:hypothetical protein
MIASSSTELATLGEVLGSEVSPGWELADPFDPIADPCRGRHTTTSEALEQAVRRHIAQRTWGRLRELQVEVDAHGVVVRGSSPTYYLKQRALAAVQEVLPATPVELDIQVANSDGRGAWR